MAVFGSKAAGAKLSCGSGVGALCVCDEDLRPVIESQLDRCNQQKDPRIPGGSETHMVMVEAVMCM